MGEGRFFTPAFLYDRLAGPNADAKKPAEGLKAALAPINIAKS